MPYLVAAVVVVGAVTLLNLALALAIVRRLREHTELISRGGSGSASAAQQGLLAVGERIGGFEATTADGIRLDRTDLGAGTAVAFFSPHCQPCHERLPEFLDHAATLPDRRSAVAVVVGEGDEADSMVARLSPSALVLSGPAGEPLVTAFGTESFPAIYRMGPDGTVAAASHGTDVLKTPVPAP